MEKLLKIDRDRNAAAWFEPPPLVVGSPGGKAEGTTSATPRVGGCSSAARRSGFAAGSGSNDSMPGAATWDSVDEPGTPRVEPG